MMNALLILIRYKNQFLFSLFGIFLYYCSNILKYSRTTKEFESNLYSYLHGQIKNIFREHNPMNKTKYNRYFFTDEEPYPGVQLRFHLEIYFLLEKYKKCDNYFSYAVLKFYLWFISVKNWRKKYKNQHK